MERMKIAAVYADGTQLDGQTVTVCGWARTIRDMKTFGFIELNDGSCFRNLQVVLDAGALDNYKEAVSQNVGAALIVTGTLVLTPEAKQPLEVKAEKIEVEGVSSPDYPLQKKRHTVEYLRTIAHLRPRTNTFQAVFRVRAQDQPVFRRLPGAERGGPRHSLLLPGPGLRLRPHPHHHRQRLRGRGGDVPGDHPGYGQPAQDSRRGDRLQSGLLRQAGQPDGVRPAQRGELCHGLR